MKNTLILITIALAMSSLNMKSTTNKDESEIAQVIEQLRKAMIDGNRSVLEKLAADELSYGHSGGAVEDKTAFVENIVSGKSDFVTIDLSNQHIAIVDNAAIVRHDLKGTTNDNGKPGNVFIHVLSVWQKQKNEWKMIARQAVKKQP